MAGSFYNNSKDSVDISELAALNDDITDDFIDQLQHQLSEKLTTPQSNVPVNENDDATLFEESVPQNEETDEQKTDEQEVLPSENDIQEEIKDKTPEEGNDSQGNSTQENSKKDKNDLNQSFDDNFIKKYKAKLQKKANGSDSATAEPISYGGVAPADDQGELPSGTPSTADNTPIEALSQGNITERPITEDLKDYNDSLDFLDGNVKYSKYVIYIDPENVNFIEELTVKERKNLINGILRQQNDISITKQRFKVIQTIIRHVIILLLTISIAIPVVYHFINASLEATINNHRKAQTNWQVLYREHGKISKN